MHINLFTTCTSSGTVDSIPELNGKNLEPFRRHVDMAAYWMETINAQDPAKKVLASTLYTGVSFRAAQRIAALATSAGHTCHLYIMSIGYGLIDPEESIIPYNLSLIFDDSPKSASMYRLIGGERFNPDLWWELINSSQKRPKHPIKHVLAGADDEDTLNLFCTSATFLGMVASDIYNGVMECSKSTTIILGPSNTSQYVKAPKRLLVNGNIIPVDKDKLAVKIPGNKFDQAQRAGIYFIEKLLAAPQLKGFNAHEALQPIEYGRGSVKSTQPINFEEFVALQKEQGKSEHEAHQLLLNQGHMLSSRAFHLLWDPDAVQTIMNGSNQNAAIDALKNIGLVTPDNEEDSIELLMIFKNAIVNGGFTGSLFGAKEVVSWAQTYCEKVGKDIPGKFQSPQKLTHFIKVAGPSMGIYTAENPKVQTASFQVVA